MFQLGQAIGVSDEKDAYVVDRPINPEDVAVTICKHLGLDARNTALPVLAGRPRYLVELGEPIRELFFT